MQKKSNKRKWIFLTTLVGLVILSLGVFFWPNQSIEFTIRFESYRKDSVIVNMVYGDFDSTFVQRDSYIIGSQLKIPRSKNSGITFTIKSFDGKILCKKNEPMDFSSNYYYVFINNNDSANAIGCSTMQTYIYKKLN